MDALLTAFDKKVDHHLYIRRLGVAADKLQAGCVQLDLFSDYESLEREERLQRVLLDIRRRYCDQPRAIFKGKNLMEGSTAIERREQIGGHKARTQ